MKYPFPAVGAAAAALLATTLPAWGATPTLEQMWELVQEQQEEIDRLKDRNRELEQKVEATGAVVDRVQRQAGPAKSGGGESGGAGGTTIGGYGELHYNNWSNQSPGRADKDEIDFHRFVLFFGHEFTEDLRFFSELEIEHALSGAGEPGEVELEQAYVEFDLSDSVSAKGGVFLLPVGILNETHEPTTFYGVERNPVEKNIIPTTWWAGGAELTGRFGSGWSYNLGVHEGLKTSATSNYAVRSGRQKSAKAAASHPAFTGRIKWAGIPGLELAATFQHQSDIDQGVDPGAGGANLFETHAVWQKGPLGLRALYGHWDLDGSAPAAVGADEQKGWYVEPSYRFNEQFGVFARYNQWDNRAGDDAESQVRQVDLGVNYWPHPDVVIKADYQEQDAPPGMDEFDGFNVGIGYQF